MTRIRRPESATAASTGVGFAVACALGVAAMTASAPSVADEMLSSIVRGGRLYDNWYKETKEEAPKDSHPAYPAAMKYAQEPKTNWRCKECHGWDYLGRDGAYSKGDHFTGIKGIQGMAGVDPDRIRAVLRGETHGYGGLMDDEDLRDLANFVSSGQVDMDRFIDRASRRARGNRVKRESYYTTICAGCHGKDGLKPMTTAPLGKVAKSNPWEALHKVLNGHPGANMPALRVLDMQVLVDILAYVQTLPTEILSSIVRGGRLYDNWYKEIDEPVPGISHPAYPAAMKFAQEPKTNWRCKECHGWDYLGRDGAYSEGDRFTGIEGIRGMSGADPARIVAVLKDHTHGYRGLMDDEDFRDLANFVSRGQVDMDRFIDRASRRARGDEVKREAYYTTICARCHGAAGLKITTMPPLGRVARSNPWEALHKIVNGHPAEQMPALRVLGMEVLVDILAYVQTLPPEK